MKHFTSISLFILCLMASWPSHAQKHLRLDSVRVEKRFNHRTTVYEYDSQNRYIGNKEDGFTVEYDQKGRVAKTCDITKTRLLRKSQGQDSDYLTTCEEQYFEYDEKGHLVLDYSQTDGNITFKNEYTYDAKDRLTSRTQYRYLGKKIRDAQKHVYIYNRKGILKARKEYIFEGTLFWQGDKIVETEPRWREVSHDRCDKAGNIILHRDYETNDTIRYFYAEEHRLVKKEMYRNGQMNSKMEYYYDHHGNVIRADNFYVTTFGTNPVKHAYTYTINYDLNTSAEDTDGIKQDLHLKNQEEMKPFILEEIDYKPKMVNIPVRVSSSDLFMTEENMYLYYSWDSNKDESVDQTIQEKIAGLEIVPNLGNSGSDTTIRPRSTKKKALK